MEGIKYNLKQKLIGVVVFFFDLIVVKLIIGSLTFLKFGKAGVKHYAIFAPVPKSVDSSKRLPALIRINGKDIDFRCDRFWNYGWNEFSYKILLTVNKNAFSKIDQNMAKLIDGEYGENYRIFVLETRPGITFDSVELELHYYTGITPPKIREHFGKFLFEKLTLGL